MSFSVFLGIFGEFCENKRGKNRKFPFQSEAKVDKLPGDEA
jgi:hypothetical protein